MQSFKNWRYVFLIRHCDDCVFTYIFPLKFRYDITIGTSDKGAPVDEFDCPPYKHLLVLFGGLQGLEAALENDDTLNLDDPSLLFDHYLNTLPGQGSRTIRTEEAILVSLAALRPKLNPKVRVTYNSDIQSNDINWCECKRCEYCDNNMQFIARWLVQTISKLWETIFVTQEDEYLLKFHIYRVMKC